MSMYHGTKLIFQLETASYNFDESMTKNTLLQVISEMYNVSYTVVADK